MPGKQATLFDCQRPEQAAQRSSPTIRHAHARVVDLLPVLERLMHRALPAVIVRVVVVLEVVTDEELVLRLCAKQQAEAKLVEQRPRKGVHEVQREGTRREDRERRGVGDNQDQLEVGRAARRRPWSAILLQV